MEWAEVGAYLARIVRAARQPTSAWIGPGLALGPAFHRIPAGPLELSAADEPVYRLGAARPPRFTSTPPPRRRSAPADVPSASEVVAPSTGDRVSAVPLVIQQSTPDAEESTAAVPAAPPIADPSPAIPDTSPAAPAASIVAPAPDRAYVTTQPVVPRVAERLGITADDASPAGPGAIEGVRTTDAAPGTAAQRSNAVTRDVPPGDLRVTMTEATGPSLARVEPPARVDRPEADAALGTAPQESRAVMRDVPPARWHVAMNEVTRPSSPRVEPPARVEPAEADAALGAAPQKSRAVSCGAPPARRRIGMTEATRLSLPRVEPPARVDQPETAETAAAPRNAVTSNPDVRRRVPATERPSAAPAVESVHAPAARVTPTSREALRQPITAGRLPTLSRPQPAPPLVPPPSRRGGRHASAPPRLPPIPPQSPVPSRQSMAATASRSASGPPAAEADASTALPALIAPARTAPGAAERHESSLDIGAIEVTVVNPPPRMAARAAAPAAGVGEVTRTTLAARGLAWFGFSRP
jgi:hypothetical protein